MQGFESFFRTAAGFPPWPYQTRLATEGEWPRVLHVPTGAGKTAAVLLGWIWRRRFHPDPAVRKATPRRLVYTLPMRVLVSQTFERATSYVQRLGFGEGQTEDPIRVALLMGGTKDREWWLHPDEDLILVGTSDMLLSRALNRGYAESRFHWPIDFGLLNNDALWIFDEIQLLSEGLATSRQLDGLRAKLGCWGRTPSLWMSATYHPGWLHTVDASPIGPGQVWRLEPADLESAPDLARRMHAAKRLQRVDLTVPDLQSKERPYLKDLAALVAAHHQPGSLTLVVMNTVQRAQMLFARMRDARVWKEARGSDGPPPEIVLLHSQFRMAEREALNRRLLSGEGRQTPAGRVIVATQVVEAGVDISARTLITELAPWPSLVQRFGRVNRYGEHEQAAILWIDVDGRASSPYGPEELDEARRLLEAFEGRIASPDALRQVPYEGRASYRYVLRRKDLVELFDTTPDLSGTDIDVSRFIRADADLDAHLFWRPWDGEEAGQAPPADWPPAQRAELCPVPVYGKTRGLQEFLRRIRDKARAWRWDPIEGRWSAVTEIDSVRPGQVLLLPARAGGYDEELGWTADAADGPVTPAGEWSPGTGPGQREAESTAGDPHSATRPWITLREHTDHVVAEMESLLARLPDDRWPETVVRALRKAARFHDWGKAHPRFQRRFLEAAGPEEHEQRAGLLWAKAPAARLRPLIRHELASALAFLACGSGEPDDDLAAFLIMGHHGKVRVGLRALAGSAAEPGEGRRLMGVGDGDRLPEDGRVVDLGGGFALPPVTMDLSLLELGAEGGQTSWLARVLALRDRPDLGPFRLAYLEALVRVADIRASMKEVPGHASR